MRQRGVELDAHEGYDLDEDADQYDVDEDSELDPGVQAAHNQLQSEEDEEGEDYSGLDL